MLGSRAWFEVPLQPFQKSAECVAKLVHGLYLVVSSALERLLLVAARVRRELQQGSAAINFRLCTFGILFNNNHGVGRFSTV